MTEQSPKPPQFAFEGDIGIPEGASIETATALWRGAIVVLERIGERAYAIRCLSRAEAMQHEGPMYYADPDRDSGVERHQLKD